jgi:hypothetical protein
MTRSVMAGPPAVPHGEQPRRRRTVWLVVLLIGILLIGLALGWFLRDPRRNLDVRTGFAPEAYLAEAPSDIRNTTAEACSGVAYCVQAAESSRIRILRFSSEPAARAEAVRLAPHAWPSDWFVVAFLQPDSMTPDDYRLVESTVDGTASDSPD